VAVDSRLDSVDISPAQRRFQQAYPTIVAPDRLLPTSADLEWPMVVDAIPTDHAMTANKNLPPAPGVDSRPAAGSEAYRP
jgi:hypothetical protein